MILNIFSYTSWPFVCLLWGIFYEGSLPIFKSDYLGFWYCFLFCYWVVGRSFKICFGGQPFSGFFTTEPQGKPRWLFRCKSFCLFLLSVVSKKLLPRSISRGLFPMCSHSSVVHLGLPFKLLIHLGWRFAYSIRKAYTFILLHEDI